MILTNENILQGLPPGFRNITVSSGIRAAARRVPNKPALICGDRQRTYAQLIEAMNRVANGVMGLGLLPGQNAAIISPNALEYIEIVCGVSDIGAAIATPNPKLTGPELADICNDAQARILFVHPDSLKTVDRSLMKTVEHVIVLDKQYDDFLKKASALFNVPVIPEWATFSIPYTSGTTGKPKGVMLPHRARSMTFLGYAAEYGIYSPDDYFLAFAPMCHGAGLAYAMSSIFFGGTTEIMPSFDAETVLRAVHSGRVTGMFTVPTHYHVMFSMERPLLDSLRGNRLKGIVANAAPLAQSTKEQIVEYFGDGLLHETYGSTEAGTVSNLRPQDQLRKRNCVGLPFVGTTIKLLDDKGEEVGPNEVGELFSTSPTLFNGYWGKEEATKETLKDGWVGVGDLAMRDEEGYLYIVDRKKDMVISGGINIYPREIEDVIDTHPAVKESAAFGVPDERWGELVVMAVVSNEGTSIGAEELEQFARQNLASYKLPKKIVPIECLPRNANGKILKTELRKWYAKMKADGEAGS
ncbi:class I adenylate-forming enzyme family protein [Paraburkholderia phymatum]|uniref:class I adenylate-forming enzyme family protein n=1 Tax=Paraburkholderia phymatum TaxID=148447 RepID=UPI00316CDACC